MQKMMLTFCNVQRQEKESALKQDDDTDTIFINKNSNIVLRNPNLLIKRDFVDNQKDLVKAEANKSAILHDKHSAASNNKPNSFDYGFKKHSEKINVDLHYEQQIATVQKGNRTSALQMIKSKNPVLSRQTKYPNPPTLSQTPRSNNDRVSLAKNSSIQQQHLNCRKASFGRASRDPKLICKKSSNQNNYPESKQILPLQNKKPPTYEVKPSINQQKCSTMNSFHKISCLKKQSQRKDKQKDHAELSPKKVSVNFELHFSKNLSKTKTSNKNNQSASVVKKQSRSQQKQQQSDQEFQNTEVDGMQKSREQAIALMQSKNSAQKYIQKVQRQKKYKSNKFQRQVKFGLNVLPASSYDKNDSYYKYKEKTKQEILRQQIQKSVDVSLTNLEKLLDSMESQDVSSLTLKSPQQQSAIEASECTALPQTKKSVQYEQISVTLDSKRLNKVSRKNVPSLHKVKNHQHPLISSGDISVFERPKQKFERMLRCLDEVLNSFCCRLTAGRNSQLNYQQSQSLKKVSHCENSQKESLVSTASMIQPDPELSFDQLENSLSKRNTKLKFLYYVGSGNNKNLIRSLLKKRFWWAETDSIENAHFIWTQLKLKEVLQKQQKMSDKKIEQPDSWHFKARDGDENQGKQHSIPKKYIKKYRQTRAVFEKDRRKIFHQNMKKSFLRKLNQKDFEFEYLRQLEQPSVIHNHYDSNFMLGNKKALFYNLKSYGEYRKVDVTQIIPITFHIEKTDSRQFRSLVKYSKINKNCVWIVKPGENSNRGNGIFLQKSVDKIKTHIDNYCTKHSFIVQKYIKGVFLYNRRKFDIRVYLLMSTIGGITKFYWYQEGYLRTCSEIYDASDLSDVYVHLTNDAIQAKGDTYSKFQKGNKISFNEFQRYLDSNYAAMKYSVGDLEKKMRAIAKTVIQSTYARLDSNKKTNGLQLFGLDFLIDKNFKPWLLEVNTNPCLELSSPVLERLIPRMLENMMRITIDPLFRPATISKHQSYLMYDNLFETNKFELLFDSLFDCDFEWEEICQKGNLKGRAMDFEDEDETFDDNGKQMSLED